MCIQHIIPLTVSLIAHVVKGISHPPAFLAQRLFFFEAATNYTYVVGHKCLQLLAKRNIKILSKTHIEMLQVGLSKTKTMQA